MKNQTQDKEFEQLKTSSIPKLGQSLTETIESLFSGEWQNANGRR